MTGYLKKGWSTTLRQPFVLVVVFLYHFLWGFILYQYISSVVVPLLHRYPGDALPKAAVHLFLAESQFRILKTDLTHPYLWLLLGLFLLRMAMTPLINAGIYFSLHHTQYNAGYRFFKGVRQLGGAFLLYYIARMLLTFAPLYWLVPIAKNIVVHTYAYDELALRLLPYLAGCLVYGYLVNLCFTYMQIAKTTDENPLKSLLFVVRHSVTIAFVTVILLLLSGLITALAVTASLIWAGLLSLILFQLYRFVSIFCKIWTVSSQYQVWMCNIRL